MTLGWETATELDNAGFNLYRAGIRGGPYTKINPALIPAQGNAVAGANYRFADRTGFGTFDYILADLDYSGETSLYGPIWADENKARTVFAPSAPPTVWQPAVALR